MCKNIFLVMIIFTFSSFNSISQFSKSALTEGTDFWFAMPNVKASQDEPVRWGTYPVFILISSKTSQTINISSADGTLNENVAVEEGIIKEKPLTDFLSHKTSEIITTKGINIKGTEPFSATIFYAYKWTGEAFTLIPTEFLGKSYVTLNMYQDRTKMHSGETDDKPSQILIIATEDLTKVTYIPTAETEKGVKAQASKTIMLNKGQTYLILSKIIPSLNQDWKTDLTGTQISSDKPIAVISGHTKGAFPRYTASLYGIKADFMRNLMLEMIHPVESLGYEYVSAPFKYQNRPYSANVPDEKGDIIRFVATEDNTNIYQMRQDGSGFKQICTNLKIGQWYSIIEQEVAAYYKSDKKIIVGQYGKSWLDHVPPPVADKNAEEPQNPSRNGQGMLLTLTPVNRWVDNASFKTFGGMNHFITLTFNSENKEKIFLNGDKITNKYNSGIKFINGTEFAYLTIEIPAGNHKISTIENAKFAAYVYGNYDYTKDGFAYSFPVSCDNSITCSDTIKISENKKGSLYYGTVWAEDLGQNSECAAIHSVLGLQLNNMKFISDTNFKYADKTYNYKFQVIDNSKYANATLLATNKSGLTYTKNFNYTPNIICKVSDADWSYSPIRYNSTKSIIVENLGTEELDINSISWLDSIHFSVSPLNFPRIIPPGQSINLNVTFRPSEADISYYTLCSLKTNTLFSKTISEWRGIGVGSYPEIEPVNWYVKQFGNNVKYDDSLKGYLKTSYIVARGNRSLKNIKLSIINDLDGAFLIDSSSIPNELDSLANKKYVNLYFKPNKSKSYQAKLIVDAEFNFSGKNYLVSDTTSLNGQGELSTGVDSLSENSELYKIYPNPAEDVINIDFFGNNEDVAIKLFDLNLREIVFNSFEKKNNFISLNLEGLPSGTYYLRIYLNGKSYDNKISIVR